LFERFKKGQKVPKMLQLIGAIWCNKTHCKTSVSRLLESSTTTCSCFDVIMQRKVQQTQDHSPRQQVIRAEKGTQLKR